MQSGCSGQEVVTFYGPYIIIAKKTGRSEVTFANAALVGAV